MIAFCEVTVNARALPGAPGARQAPPKTPDFARGRHPPGAAVRANDERARDKVTRRAGSTQEAPDAENPSAASEGRGREGAVADSGAMPA